ncbi:glycosyltransferase family 2 protein [Thermodesulfatator atlanticus]|uniref:glycosyltransferase family 2 protein n=1 Tax=Thermodesulfatator atlanticus TaxID=501497 RepID=UPI0003B378C5|nr:glycosyltransferase family 2 protein [Thermodesulfatator atlanticus]
MKKNLSIVLITFNSERYLSKVLKSCIFAQEIVIVDSGSTDNTEKIAREFGARFIPHEWLGFGRQKQFAVEQARNDWVFVLDSDEIIPEELQHEILDVLVEPQFKAYKVPRLNYFFGKPIKTCGLYPDYTIRLFNRKFARFSDDAVHEKVLYDGPLGKFKNYLIHFAYESVDEFIEKQNRYSSLARKPNRLKAIFSPKWTFFQKFILQRGFLDGWHGYLIAKLYSQYTFWKYVKT